MKHHIHTICQGLNRVGHQIGGGERHAKCGTDPRIAPGRGDAVAIIDQRADQGTAEPARCPGDKGMTAHQRITAPPSDTPAEVPISRLCEPGGVRPLVRATCSVCGMPVAI